MLENLWWLQLLKRHLLNKVPDHRFGTERSEVRILSPRPIALKALEIDERLAEGHATLG
jgi:hypothetical protein